MNDLNTQLRRNAANDEAHRLGYSIEVDLDTNLTTHTAIAHRLDATEPPHFLCRTDSNWLIALEEGVEILKRVEAGEPWP